MEVSYGFIYLRGNFNTQISFDSTNVLYSTNPNIESVFFAKFNDTGDYIWGNKITSTNNLYEPNRQRGLAVDINSNVYITGAYWGETSFNNTTLSCSGAGGTYVAKYDTYGKEVWVIHSNCEYGGGGYDLVIDMEMDLYLAGRFIKTISFDSIDTIYGSNSVPTAFVAKFDGNGKYLCSKKVISNDTANATTGGGGVVLTSIANVIMGGSFIHECSFDTTVLNAGSVYDSYIWKTCLPCDSTGNPEDVYETIQEQSSFTIYPNPNNGNFQLRILNDTLMHTKSEVSIYNTIGQEVYHVLLKSTTTQLNLTALASGFYYVKFGGEVQKMVISY
jgi:hypothetical protein